MIVVYKRYGKQRDGHWLLNSVLLYHKMQFVQFVLHRRSLSSTDNDLFLVLLRLVTHFRLQFDKLPCHLLSGDNDDNDDGLIILLNY